MNNIFFIDNNLKFKANKSNLTQEDVLKNRPFAFHGENDFITFYTQYNGLVFPYGAFFYRDSFYQASSNDYNFLDVGAFFEISDANNSIEKMWKALKEDLETKELALKYFPFGNDSSGNLYCIESESGTVYYLTHENPKNITKVAPTFLEFCNKIQGEMR